MEQVSDDINSAGNLAAINANLGIINTLLLTEGDGRSPSEAELIIYNKILQLPPLLDGCAAYYTGKSMLPWTYSKNFIESVRKILGFSSAQTPSELTSSKNEGTELMNLAAKTENYTQGELLSGPLSVHHHALNMNQVIQQNTQPVPSNT